MMIIVVNKKVFWYSLLSIVLFFYQIGVCQSMKFAQNKNAIVLKQPKYNSNVSVEVSILKRRSVRSFANESVSFEDFSQILWSAYGITDKVRNFHSVPSAGAIYPLEVFVVVNNVRNIPVGIYKYFPEDHKILCIKDGDYRKDLFDFSYGQMPVKESAFVVIFCANYEKTMARYRQRGIKYVDIEVGHCGQNVYLQCVSLGLGTVAIGAFDENRVKSMLDLDSKIIPIYLMPVGKI